MIGTMSIEKPREEVHNSIPDDLLILGEGKYSSKASVDHMKNAGGGVASNNSSDESHPKEPKTADAKTWSEWAAEKAVAAEHVAAQSAIKVKDSAVSTVKYVTDAATSKPPSNAESPTDIKNHGVASEDKKSATRTLVDSGTSLKDTIAKNLGYPVDSRTSGSSVDRTKFVQDVVNRYSTTARTPEVGQQYRAPTRSMAETFKQSTVAALTPGEGEKELAKTITDSLSSLPTLLKEKMWISSSSTKGQCRVDGMPPSTDSDFYPDNSTTTGPAGGLLNRVVEVASSATGLIPSDSPATVEKSFQHAEHENGGPTIGKTSSTKVTGEEKDPVTPEKLMGLWTIASGNMDCAVSNGALDSESLLSPESPETPRSASSAGMMKQTNSKAEALAEAHRSRVATEANAYLEAEARKAAAHAQKMHSDIDTQRYQLETKAIENLRKEELRAELLVKNAEVKAEKLLAEANSKAASMRATAEEEYARSMADAKTKADRSLAEIEETKQREIAELYDKVEEMILMREFPLAQPEHKNRSVVKKVKEKVLSHLRGY